jgi:hypothetical protein
LNPRFIYNASQIVFSSNRENDTLGIEPEDILDMPKYFDLFVYDLANHSPILKRIAQTPLASELRPESYGFNTISYLSDENGIYNNYLAAIDSTVSSVDTAIHYRYFVHSKAISDYPASIIDQHTNLKTGKKAMLYFEDNFWKIFIENIPDYSSATALQLTNTNYMAQLKKTLKKAEQTKKEKEAQLITDSVKSQEGFVEQPEPKTKTKQGN